MLGAYRTSYNADRTHLGLNKDTPDGRPIEPLGAGPVVAEAVLGGLHHRYRRAQACRSTPFPVQTPPRLPMAPACLEVHARGCTCTGSSLRIRGNEVTDDLPPTHPPHSGPGARGRNARIEVFGDPQGFWEPQLPRTQHRLRNSHFARISEPNVPSPLDRIERGSCRWGILQYRKHCECGSAPDGVNVSIRRRTLAFHYLHHHLTTLRNHPDRKRSACSRYRGIEPGTRHAYDLEDALRFVSRRVDPQLNVSIVRHTTGCASHLAHCKPFHSRTLKRLNTLLSKKYSFPVLRG